MPPETYTIPRSGQPPLKFTGNLIANSDGQRQAAADHNRYHMVAIYRTKGNQYVLSIRYVTDWRGEVGNETAAVYANAKELTKAIEDYNPTLHVAGFPPHETYEAKQRRLLEDIRSRWKSQVMDILNSDEFAVEIA